MSCPKDGCVSGHNVEGGCLLHCTDTRKHPPTMAKLWWNINIGSSLQCICQFTNDYVATESVKPGSQACFIQTNSSVLQQIVQNTGVYFDSMETIAIFYMLHCGKL